MSPASNLSSSTSLFPRWFSKSTLVLSVIFLALIIPCTTAKRRHRHKHGGRIAISSHLHKNYASSWNTWEQSIRLKRHNRLTDPSADQSDDEIWGSWMQMSACSRPCGGGVLQELRSCLSDGKCLGRDRRYSSCNIQECPEGTMDFRAAQCARYDRKPFEGRYYTWVPYTKGPRKCELNCQPEGERFYFRHENKVRDGTRCEPGQRDVCVDGECVPVGCDFVIGSDTAEDKCRVCGGDGSSCTTITGTIGTPTMIQGYNDIVLIPAGATNIYMDEVKSSNNYLALRNDLGHYYLNGNWKIDFPGPINCAGTKFYYERRPGESSLMAPEIVRSQGPTNETLYLVILYQEKNPGIAYEFSISKDIKETENIIYEWMMNGWGECSVSCGGGHMTRDVSCVKASDHQAVDDKLELCDPRLTPASNKSCNEALCESSWQTGDWTRCSSACGTVGVQYRHTFCGQKVSEGILAIVTDSSCEEIEGPKPKNIKDCNIDSECPTYHIGLWSQCDKLCGTGTKTRKVICHQSINETTVILEDNKCPNVKPATEMSCDVPPCQGVDWIVSHWSKCKSPHGASVRTRKVICVTIEGNVVEDDLCDSERKPLLSEECKKPIEYSSRWYASEWSECSEYCGEGLRTRHVFCGAFEEGKIVSILEDGQCDRENRLSSSEVCIGVEKCDNQWYTAPFGKCSKRCGGGDKKREIFCFNNSTLEKYTNCEHTINAKPFEREDCNVHACSEDEIIGISLEDEDLPWCEDEVTIDKTDIDEIITVEPEDQELENDEDSGSGDGEYGITSETTIKIIDTSITTEDDHSTTVTETILSDATNESENSAYASSVYVTDSSILEPDNFTNISDAIRTITSVVDDSTTETDQSDSSLPTDDVTTSSIESIVSSTDFSDISTMQTDSTVVNTDPSVQSTNSPAMESNKTTPYVHPEGGAVVFTGVIFDPVVATPTTEILSTPTINKRRKREIASVEDEINTANEEGSGFEDDYGSGEIESKMKMTTMSLPAMVTNEDSSLKCKPRLKIDEEEAPFGNCPDGNTPAEGPFKKGCKIVASCEKTQFGCCPDEISPAKGKQYLGCLSSSICHGSLFNCCSDNYTEAKAPSNNESCSNLIEFHCEDSRFGCCPDDITQATGKDFAGCPVDECEGSSGCLDCLNAIYGCCPDGVTEALGEYYEGCDEGSGEGSGMDITTMPSMVDVLPECSHTSYGCCQDNYTAAHGENYEGCCLSSEFGCCPDDISIAKGPNYEGCRCEFTKFKCCPDNQTAARGLNNDGCGCEYTRFGCCPDNQTPSLAINQSECHCSTFKFGCCPDGESFAKGIEMEGCGCANTKFKCCEDDRTAASGPDKQGCGCEASEYGCCPDGYTPADGNIFEGCKDDPQIIPGEVCGFHKDRGPCRNFTVKFYFDMSYGGCTRFWYGGCEGNLNKFMTEKECEAVCVDPEGPASCQLPSVSGPCTGSYASWYHDRKTQSCRPFGYGGCLGNKNKYSSKEECEEVCVLPKMMDVCELDVMPGPCRGNYARWHYDKSEHKCIPFTYGGCKSNTNNFLSENECMHRCIYNRAPEICSQSKASGRCNQTIPRWYYDFTETRCMPFYYTGCDGNANRFHSSEECESICNRDDSATGNICSLPISIGNCTDFVPKYFYNVSNDKCQEFLYGGCAGNANNYATMSECEQTCRNRIPSPVFETEFCFLEPEPGTCGDFAALWHYDSTDGACKQFLYSGCNGNANRFKTKQECDNNCGDSQDICKFESKVGPCNREQKQYFYDYNRDECLPFLYGGCQGNKNRFDSMLTCQRQCQPHIVHTDVPDDREVDENRPNICNFPMYTGDCQEAIPSWYYDRVQGKCIGFAYGGCSGNANRFQSIELCERQCGIYRNKDVCRLQIHDGHHCEGTDTIIKWYHNPLQGICQHFGYTGCGGNGNRFSSQDECESECMYIDTILPTGHSAETNIAICELEIDVGPCTDGYKRWYFNVDTVNCELIKYGGCGGNLNRFKNFNTCSKFCEAARIKHRSQVAVESTTAGIYDPCVQEKLHCHNLVCSYGITERFDANNCNLCDCFDPCENIFCYQGSECAVELIQTRKETYDEVRYEAVCREVNQPGTCPTLSGEISECDNECESDASCSSQQKCCFNGCAYICVNPILEKATKEATVPDAVTPESGIPATITYADTKVSVEENDVANLVCQSDGNPTPVVGWFKDDRQLDVSSDSRFQLSLDYSLRIMNVMKKDKGYYRCVANNGLGSPDEREVELEVTEPTIRRPIDIIPPRDSSPVVTLGSPVTLRCWSMGWPRAHTTWWRFKTMLPTISENYQSLPFGGLRINVVTIRDLGPYTCQAYNGEGSAATNKFIVRALGPISVVSPYDRPYLHYIVNPPKFPTFAPPISTLRPTYPSHPITHSPILATVPASSAYYIPPITSRPRIPVGSWIRTNLTKFVLFSDIKIPCEVQGFPEPSVRWYHNNVLLQSSDRVSISFDNTLRIVGVDNGDTGTYKCEVTNQYGVSSSSVSITVQGVYVHPDCTDSPYFANCKLVVQAEFCTNVYYKRFCCRSCTVAGHLPSFGPHLEEQARRSRRRK